MRSLTLFLLVAILAAGPGCREEAEPNGSTEVPRNVRVLELGAQSVAEYFEISGPVVPVRGTDLSAQESGPVVSLPVAKGRAVEKGQMILEIERRILKAEMESARAALAMQAYNVEKVRQLFEAGKVSRIELLTAESSYQQARSIVDISTERYDRAGLKAPFDGILVDRYVELGELVAPGVRVARVIDPYTLKLEAYLTDVQVRWVTEGQPATILLGESRQPAAGVVTWVGMEAERMTGKFRVEIEMPNPDLVLHSGVIGRARLGKNVTEDAISIPLDAVLNGRAGPTAFVVDGDRAIRRQLRLGPSQGLMVVVESGLAEGNLLVVRGHRELRDGSLVRVTETADQPDGSRRGDPDETRAEAAGSRIAEPASASAGGDR